MICDGCEHWQPVYAPFVHRLVPCCVLSDTKNIKWEVGKCKYYEKRKPKDKG